jgi:serine protease AprX
LDDLVTIDGVRRIEESGEIELRNDKARLILGCDVEQASGSNPHKAYQGNGQVIAVADTGLDKGLTKSGHPAFGNRMRACYPINGSTEDYDGHGTHVCGSAVGDSMVNNIRIMGTAPKAQLVIQSLWNDTKLEPGICHNGDLTQLFGPPYTKNMARVHSNSWGERMRRCQLGYTQSAEEIDTFVWEHQDMVIFWAAGNEAVYDPTTKNVLKGQIGSEAAAKNCITVGASENERPEVQVTYGEIQSNLPGKIGSCCVAKDRSRVAAFSSRGPTRRDDADRSRVKPDVVAPGTHILSADSTVRREPPVWPGPDKLCCYESGTSMATPLVAGCAAVLRQVLIKHNHNSPSAALIKALLINGADFLSPPTPNIHSGYGRVNLASSIKIAQLAEGTGIREHQLSDTDKEFSDKILVAPNHTSLKATLVWSDPPGNMIKNRLRLALQGPSSQRYPSRSYDNVQQVFWEEISPGEVTITVKIMSYLDQSPQPYAVVWQLF